MSHLQQKCSDTYNHFHTFLMQQNYSSIVTTLGSTRIFTNFSTKLQQNKPESMQICLFSKWQNLIPRIRENCLPGSTTSTKCMQQYFHGYKVLLPHQAAAVTAKLQWNNLYVMICLYIDKDMCMVQRGSQAKFMS